MKHTKLLKMDACDEGYKFACKFRTLKQAWNACDRPDWLLWYAERKGADKKAFVRVALKTTRLVESYTTDKRVSDCLCTVERWLDGQATKEELNAASYAAWAAARAASAANTAASAANAAASAANAAASAANAAAWAASAANAAASAAAWDAARAAEAGKAREAINAQICNIIRSHITFS